MKTEEIVATLQARIPLFTDKFSDVTQITSLTSSGNTATAVAPNHGVSVGETVIIAGSLSDVAIASFTRTGITGLIETSTDHDITDGLETVDVAGANEAEFNGNFKILQTVNRRTIKVQMLDSGPTVATGSLLLINGESIFRGYNGTVNVTAVLDVNTFQYETAGSDLLPSSGSPVVNRGLRISGSASVERLLDAYTQQPPNDLWMFAVLGDVAASKNRNMQNDTVDTLGRAQQNEGFQQLIIQPFSVYVFVPTSNSLAARDARDLCEDIFQYVCGSLLFAQLSSGLACPPQNAVTFVNHGFAGYNSAFYIHEYQFEQTTYLTFADTIGYDPDTAFRDIDLIMGSDIGNETFDTYINLDDEALP